MIVFVLFLLSYLVLVLIFFFQWKSIPDFRLKDINLQSNLNISIIIAVKNEEKTILSLLRDLSNQSYHPEKFEVIVVDDHSGDNTFKSISTFMETARFNLQIIQLTNTYSKKEAIREGISLSKGEIIICTDGDCRAGVDWISTIASFFEQTNAKMVCGPVTFYKEENKSIFKKLFVEMQTIEFASLVGSGAASLNSGFPNMCNGANLAYRKDTFLEVGGFMGNEHIRSGDDEFLMHKIHMKYPRDVHFLKSQEAIIQTEPSTTLTEFFKQRLRWAGKWENYSGWKVKAMALFIAFVNASHLALFFYLFVDYFSLVTIAATILARWLIEFVFLYVVLRFLNKPVYLISYILLIVVYPVYVLVFAIGGRIKKQED